MVYDASGDDFGKCLDRCSMRIVRQSDRLTSDSKGKFCFYPTLTLLVLAFLLQKVTEQLNMTDYIIDLAQPCYRSLAS